LPYLYTLFQEASVDGMPVMRPVFFADPKDPALRTEEEAFLLGADILVVPHLGESEQRVAALPKGIWRSVSLVGEDSAKDINQPDLRVRGGSIVPAGPVMEYTGEKPLNPLTLIVCADETGKASGRLYEDAGEGFGYRKGIYRATRFRVRKSGSNYFLTVRRLGGDLPEMKRMIEVVLLEENGTRTFHVSARAVDAAGTQGLLLK
jgi:alpha-glucosidase